MPKLGVNYEYLNAEQVDELKANARNDQLWNLLPWGSYGKTGKETRRCRVIAELETDHLEAILITQPHVTPQYRATILELLKERYKND
jgi:hypothetical protein